MSLAAAASAAQLLRFLALALVLAWSALPFVATPSGPRVATQALRRRLATAALLGLAAGLFELTVRSVELLDLASVSVSPWWALLARTQFGRVWVAEQTALLLLLAIVGIRSSAMGRLRRALAVAVAAAALLVGPLASHSAALDDPTLPFAVHALHLGAVALWLGGVLTLASAVVFRASALHPDDARRLLVSFSRVAPLLVALAVGSGVALATWHIAAWPRLLATPYGGLLVAKILCLVVALSAAAKLRYRSLPALERSSAAIWTTTRRSLVVEAAFAAAAACVAAGMAETTPASHDVVSWWLPFRFSIRATWGLPGVPERVTAALAVASIYGGVAAGRLWRRDLRRGGTLALAGAGFAAALAWPAIAVKAYPGTYWTPAVPYDAVSVARGRSLFRAHCVSCHGLAGRGDGPLASTLPKPAANLTEPHTADHTAGDMFWWLTYGIPESGMPSFDLLSADARWDLINFLRAFAAGYQARILGPRVSPDQPWLPEVDFPFSTTGGESALLRDFRDRSAVILVLFSTGASDARMAELRRHATELRDAGAEIIAVPIDAAAGDPAPLRTVAAADAPPIVESYALFRRTFADPGNESDDDLPAHLELLIDRFGWIRARWRPDRDREGWSDVGLLREQLRILRDEPKLRPPPEEHVH